MFFGVFFRIMARTVKGLLTEALMESHLLQTPKMILEFIHSKSTHFQQDSIGQFIKFKEFL